MKRPPKKPKCTDELAYQVQYVGKPRGWTERYQAALHGVSTATIRRAKSMTVSRETMERHARPAPRQSAADAAKLVELLSEPETVLDRLIREQSEALEDPAVEEERQRLTHALAHAETTAEANAHELALAMLDPIVKHYVAAGDTLASALSLAGQTPYALHRAVDLAHLASVATGDPSDTDQEAHRERALRLLSDASELVATDPEILQ